MELDSVRELKFSAFKALNLDVQAIASAAAIPRWNRPRRFMAIGIASSRSRDGYKLAIRLQREDVDARRATERLVQLAKGEVDVQYVGIIRTAATSQLNAMAGSPPLLLGSSIAHYRVTAGTLGAFVRPRGNSTNSIYLLSNNHVIANSNRCKNNDDVLRPGPMDGGKRPKDRIAGLSSWVPLVTGGNTVDCAVAAIDTNYMQNDSNTIPGVGNLAGVSATGAYDGLLVSKLGRTTKLTRGKITAFEIDDVVVGYPGLGNLSFNGQIEVEGIENKPFAAGGDSGSLVVDNDNFAIGLLFATSSAGGSNGKGLTYVNPIAPVLDQLKVDFL